jgi:hypothetical protein
MLWVEPFGKTIVFAPPLYRERLGPMSKYIERRGSCSYVAIRPIV